MQPQHKTISINNINKCKSNNKDTKLYIKGSGSTACLCTGKLDDQPQFIQFKHQQQINIMDIEVGGQFMIGIGQQISHQEQNSHRSSECQSINKYMVIGWGNFNGNLIYQPKILYSLNMGKRVRQISCGWNHSLILIQGSSNILGIGQNKYGQLNNVNNKLPFYHEFVTLTQETNYELNAKQIRVCAAGFRQSYWVDCDNVVYGCGESKNYQLGVTNKKQILSVIRIYVQEEHYIAQIVKIACGKKFAAFLSSQNKVYGIGTYTYTASNGQIKQYQFTKLTLIRENVIDVGCGWSHILMLDQSGKIWAQGRNNFGQLGIKVNEQNQQQDLQKQNVDNGQILYSQKQTKQIDQNKNEINSVFQVAINEPCRWVSTGTQFSFAYGASGSLYGWGWNEHQNIAQKKQGHIIWSPIKIEVPQNSNIISCKTQPAITMLKLQQKQ